MAREISHYKLHKVRSDRGYHIYRFGDLPIGLLAANYSQRSRISSYWHVKLITLKESNGKFYAGYTEAPLGYSPGATPKWSNVYANNALRHLEKPAIKKHFWDFIFSIDKKLDS